MKFVPAVAYIAVISVFSFCCAKPESESRANVEFKQRLQRARELQQEGKTTNAIAAVSEILEEGLSELQRAEALLLRAEMKIDLEDYVGALNDASDVKTNSSDVAQIYYVRGIAYNGLGTYPEALKNLTRALELSPGNSDVLFNRALAYYKLGFFDSAEADLSAAIRVHPKNFALFWRRGALRFERGDYEGSARDLLQAITLKPDAATPYRDYGLTQWFLGRQSVASDYFRKYAELGGRTESYRNALLGGCYLAAHDYPRALEFYDKALELASDCTVCYADRAIAKYYQGQLDDAFSDISKAIEMNSANGNYFKLRGILHLIRGSYESACEDFKKQVALSPRAEAGYVGLVAASVLSGRADKVIAVLHDASEKRIWGTHLWLWSRLLGVETSKEHDEYILQFSPQSWPNVLTRYYLGQVSAEEVLKSAAHSNPPTSRRRLAEAHFYIGALLASNGENEKARKHFAQAVEADQIRWPVSVLAEKQLETNWFATLKRASTNAAGQRRKPGD